MRTSELQAVLAGAVADRKAATRAAADSQSRAAASAAAAAAAEAAAGGAREDAARAVALANTRERELAEAQRVAAARCAPPARPLNCFRPAV